MTDFFDKLKLGFNRGVMAVEKGSKKALEIAKINTTIGSAKIEKEKIATLLGKKVYEYYMTGKEIPEPFISFCEELRKKDDIIASAKEKRTGLDEDSEQVYTMGNVCSCGFINLENADFCTECGAKIN